MIETILSVITSFIVNTISLLGYPGVGALMAIESAAIPLPSEIIMPFSGFLVSQGRLSLQGIAFAGALGSVFGSWVTYGLGRYGGRPLIVKYGRFVFISEHDLNLADIFFAKYGIFATFLGRILPIVRTYISIPAGISRVSFWPFTFTCFIGSYIWSLLLGFIGFKFGENWESIRGYFHQIDWVIGIVLVAGAVWWIRRHVSNLKRKV